MAMPVLKNKEWWKSKTVWAAGIAFLIAALTAAFGETSTVVAIIIALASALGIYGRATAKTSLK